MCVSAAAALAISQIGLGGLQIHQTRENNKVLRQFESNQQELNFNLASKDAQRQFAALASNQAQNERATSQSIQETRREALQAQGSSIAAAAGTAGLDVQSIFDDFERQKILGIRNQETSLEFELDAADVQRESIYDNEYNRRLNSRAKPILDPNIYTQLLQLGVSGYSSYLGAQ